MQTPNLSGRRRRHHRSRHFDIPVFQSLIPRPFLPRNLGRLLGCLFIMPPGVVVASSDCDDVIIVAARLFVSARCGETNWIAFIAYLPGT